MDNNKIEVNHFYWLDLLRFIAAFAVVMCHFRGAFFVEYSLLPPEQQGISSFVFYSMTRLGQEAVLIFFVLSGFLVGGRSFKRMMEGNFQGRSYCIDRVVRIMLPLIAALLLYIPVTLFIGKDINWSSWFGCLFSLQGIFTGACIEPLWSLSYEVWFYVIVAALFLILQKRAWGGYWGLVLMLVCLLVFTKLSSHYLFIWLLGAMAYLVRPKSFKWWAFAGSVIGISVMIVLLQLSSAGHLDTGSAKAVSAAFNREALEVVYGMCCCVFIQQLITMKPKKKVLLKLDGAGTILASFSYTLYLAHVLVLRALEYLGAPKSESLSVESIGLWILWLLLALVVCYLLYLCFEKHTKPVKRFLKGKLIR